VELPVPPARRMKYGFRVETMTRVFYASDNRVVPFREDALSIPFNHYFFPFIHAIDAPRIPDWVPNTVWYQIFPERFHNGSPGLSPEKVENWDTGEPTPYNFFGGDLPGIRQKLGYLKELGVNGIYLTPVFQSPSSHKYDTEDYFKIDEHFGNLDDLKGLVREAHEAGMRVMLDAVFNHIGALHPFWRDVLEKQEQSPYRDYFHIHTFPVQERYENPRELGFDTFSFSAKMPKWNTENPAARKYLLDAAAYWIRECDIDGWRLDVANEVSFDFWREFSTLVHGIKKDFYVLGEIWHDASPWINGGFFDAVMNYPLGFAIIDFFLKRNISTAQFNERLYAALSRYSDLHNQLAFNLLDSHDTARALHIAGGDKRALRAAFTMLFLLPGSPCVFYGTEIGMSGAHDPANRKPMLWDEAKQDRELFAFFQRLIAFRQEYIALINNARVCYEPLGDDGSAIWTFADGKRTLRAVYAGTNGVNVSIIDRALLSSEAIEDGFVLPYSMAIYIGIF
jgi:glycosidase